MCGKIAFEADMELRVGFIQCGAFGTSSSWTCVASLLEHAVVFSLQTPGICWCLGSSVDAPRLWSAAPLSLISLQTLALGLSLMEKENLFLFSLGPWSIVCFRCKGFSCCLFFFVTCGDCCSLTSDSCFSGHLKSWTHAEYTPMHAAILSTYQEVYILSIQCKQTETIGVIWGEKPGLHNSV